MVCSASRKTSASIAYLGYMHVEMFEKMAVNYAGMLKLAIIQRYLRISCP